MKNNDLKSLAGMIVTELLDAGFVIQRYDAYSTDSIYLKLDYGVCSSIRISNHSGKKHLKYRYNIGPHIKKKYIKKELHGQYYFPRNQASQLITQIISDKAEKVRKYGEKEYRRYMAENRNKNLDRKWLCVKRS